MNRSDIHALRGLTNPVANVPQTSVGSVLSFWSIVTMLSIYLSVGSNPYASLKEWANQPVYVQKTPPFEPDFGVRSTKSRGGFLDVL